MKTGWVRQENNTGKFVLVDGVESKTLRNAFVFHTRKLARTSDLPYKLPKVDIVRKVELTRTGKAKRIIPGR